MYSIATPITPGHTNNESSLRFKSVSADLTKHA